MIVGAAVLPTAPLLVPGVSATLPEGVPKVADAIDAVVERLPAADLVVLVAAGEGALHGTSTTSLREIGRPDITVDVPIDAHGVARLSDTTKYPMYRGDELPLALTVLAVHIGGGTPIVPLTVPGTAEFHVLADLGSSIAATFSDPEMRVMVVVAGDLAAGLTDKSPLHYVSGAIFWDEQAVAAVDSGRLDALAKLGPAEARRVGAVGWAPLAVLHGAVSSVKIGMVVRHYSAPRGVGYLVASGG